MTIFFLMVKAEILELWSWRFSNINFVVHMHIETATCPAETTFAASNPINQKYFADNINIFTC